MWNPHLKIYVDKVLLDKIGRGLISGQMIGPSTPSELKSVAHWAVSTVTSATSTNPTTSSCVSDVVGGQPGSGNYRLW